MSQHSSRCVTMSAALIFLAAAVSASAQETTGPFFSVASVKRVTGEWRFQYSLTPTSLTMKGFDLNSIIRFAYSLQKEFQVSGPSWTSSGPNCIRFDLMAKTEEPVAIETVRLMVQHLLSERWHLLLEQHLETMSVFVLTPGKQPLKLQSAQPAGYGSLTSQANGWRFRNASIQRLVDAIADRGHELVIDETHLSGAYDFDVDFLRYTDTILSGEGNNVDYGPAFVRALRDLGLQLGLQRRRVPILVIKQAETVPTET